MRNIIVIIFLILVHNCFSQNRTDSITPKIELIKSNLEQKIKSLKDSLHQKNIAVISYEKITGGNAFTFSLEQFKENPCSCIEPKIIYIFWYDNGKTFGKKFDYCLDYAIVSFKESKALEFFLNNESGIAKEKIKPFEYIDEGKTYSTFVSHQESQELNLIHGTKNILKVFHELNFIKTYENKININFEYNTNLTSKKVLDLFTEMSKKLNTLK